MPGTPQQSARLGAVEAWWPLIARIASFIAGTAIMVWQTVVVNIDRPWLIVAALGMMGLPIANVLGRALAPGVNGAKSQPKDES